jgi:D-alanyl-D-alanine carboxypeptidase/D-alanyl-D-alanine-endopeptidase (penicillin-binding protein 4)
MNISRARPFWVSPSCLFAVLSLLATTSIEAQGRLGRRIDRLLDSPPFDRATWGVLVVDERGRELYSRNADRFFIPASNVKLVVAAVASVLLPPEHEAVTSVYGSGPINDGILDGDLVVYGRGDPMFSPRCYGSDTLAVGACDSLWTRMDVLARRIAARGIRHVTGAIVGDGSYFDAELVHPGWEAYDLNWWYAAPVSGLGFNDNSLNVIYRPGPTVDAPVIVSFEPQLGNFVFDNRTRTLPAGERRTIDFFRTPGTMQIWAEGGVPIDGRERTEYFAIPDPNRYFATALRAALARAGVSVAGPTHSTTDPTRFQACRATPAVAELGSRTLGDYLFPILNSSQNWFAEMLLKTLGRELADEGSWDAGLAIERRFLIDSVGVDSTEFFLSDGSGLSTGNLLTPRAFVELLQYMRQHPKNAGFLRGLPRSGQRGSLRTRFVGTPLEGRVLAKTGSILHVNTLAGYIERPNGATLAFSVMANNHAVPYNAMLAQIDSVVVQLGR